MSTVSVLRLALGVPLRHLGNLPPVSVIRAGNSTSVAARSWGDAAHVRNARRVVEWWLETALFPAMAVNPHLL